MPYLLEELKEWRASIDLERACMDEEKEAKLLDQLISLLEWREELETDIRDRIAGAEKLRLDSAINGRTAQKHHEDGASDAYHDVLTLLNEE